MIYSSDENHTSANLSWYDLHEIRHATDAFWRELATQFRLAGVSNVPVHLNRHVAYERQWTLPNFLFGQACGYDVRISYARQFQVVATPCYAAPGCHETNYRSFVVVRDGSNFECVDDLRTTRCVINTPTSHSGMNVLRALVAPLNFEGRFFSSVCISGSHEQSLRMIQRGEVDVAAIDCVTFALLAQHRPSEIEGCRVIHRTEPVPAPPYVTAASTPPEMLAAMREALRLALDQPSLFSAKETLLLKGVELLPEEAYGPIESLALMADDYGYHEVPGPSFAVG